jgi:hypothetical protein
MSIENPGIPSDGADDQAANRAEEAVREARQAAESAAGQAKEQGQQLANSAKSAASQAKEQGQQLADSAKSAVEPGLGRAGTTIASTADQGIQKAGATAQGLASTLRQQTANIPDPRAANVATQAADTLDRAANYLNQTNSSALLDDLGQTARRNPTPLLIAAGAILLAVLAIIVLGRRGRETEAA